MCKINKKSMLFGLMIGDGWISLTKKNTYLGGFSGDKDSLILVKKDLIELYGDIGKATLSTKETYSPKYNIEGITNSFNVNVKISKIFIKLGMPVGRRVEQEFLLPNWITKGSNRIKKDFLSGLYAAEGYTPAMQNNDKTLKPLGFNITKRYQYKENFNLFLKQLFDIFDSLKIKYSYRLKETYTCDKNLKAIITFDNSINNIIHLCDIFNLRYSIPKQEKLQLIKKYYTFRKEVLTKLNEAYKEAIINNSSIKDIANKYDITERQIKGWKSRKTGIRIPNNFPNFTQFQENIVHYKPR